MVKSMTSFGRSSSENSNQRSLTVEMKSVNSRYLEINIRAPKALISLEEEIRKMISESLSRGKVDVFINLKKYTNNEGTPKVDLKLAKEYFNNLKEIENYLGVKNDVTAMQIAKFQDVIVINEEEEDLEIILKEIKPLVKIAIEKMIEMRKIEGEKLKEDILIKISEVDALVNKIKEFAHTIPEIYKLKLEERLSDLLKGIDIDENRIATEVCIFADKSSVDEEIIRLNSHINQIRETLKGNTPIGRKLDFIIQEMNRETNTIGSKSSDINLTNIVIDIKNLIEKIREQVQNIE